MRSTAPANVSASSPSSAAASALRPARSVSIVRRAEAAALAARSRVACFARCRSENEIATLHPLLRRDPLPSIFRGQREPAGKQRTPSINHQSLPLGKHSPRALGPRQSTDPEPVIGPRLALALTVFLAVPATFAAESLGLSESPPTDEETTPPPAPAPPLPPPLPADAVTGVVAPKPSANPVAPKVTEAAIRT